MARPRKNEEMGAPWVVRDVPVHIRRKVRVYAAEHDLTMAQAIEQLVDRALKTPIESDEQFFQRVIAQSKAEEAEERAADAAMAAEAAAEAEQIADALALAKSLGESETQAHDQPDVLARQLKPKYLQ